MTLWFYTQATSHSHRYKRVKAMCAYPCPSKRRFARTTAAKLSFNVSSWVDRQHGYYVASLQYLSGQRWPHSATKQLVLELVSIKSEVTLKGHLLGEDFYLALWGLLHSVLMMFGDIGLSSVGLRRDPPRNGRFNPALSLRRDE